MVSNLCMRLPLKLSYRMIAATLGIGAVACSQDTPLPEPARPQPKHDVRIQQERRVPLKAFLAPGATASVLRVRNMEPFILTLLDDISLFVNVATTLVPSGHYVSSGHGVELRCPAPRTIPADGEIEFSVESCVPTTYDPGPGGRVSGYSFATREGFVQGGIEPGFDLVRSSK